MDRWAGRRGRGRRWLYAVSPAVVSCHVNLLLLVLRLSGAERVLSVRARWAVAVVLAPFGVAAQLLWPNAQRWNYGALLTVTLVALALRREERLRQERAEPEPFPLGGDGPWGPP